MNPLRKVHFRRNVVDLQGELQAHIKIDGVIRLPAHKARKWLHHIHSRKNIFLRLHYPRSLSGHKMVLPEMYSTTRREEG